MYTVLSRFASHLVHAPPVRTVDNVNECVGLVEIVTPVRPNRLLPSDIPNVQLEVLVHEALDVEALERRREEGGRGEGGTTISLVSSCER